jgi:hypothetical protein
MLSMIIFPAGYLMGVPVTSYGLGIGQEHVEFAEAKIQARIITRDLSDAEIDALAVVAVAGEAAEAEGVTAQQNSPLVQSLVLSASDGVNCCSLGFRTQPVTR